MKSKKNSEFKLGEIVVYPKHGVGEISKIENMEISNIKTSFYVVKMEQSKLTIRVPLDKKDDVGLRKISSKKIIDEVENEFKVEKWTQESHAKRENEDQIPDLNHLPRLIWIDWMKTLSTFKYARAGMPIAFKFIPPWKSNIQASSVSAVLALFVKYLSLYLAPICISH